MRRVERMSESVFGIENSTVDPNRFYSILLDARAASVSENMCDIAETLLHGEKENAKTALEHLWRLKKNLFSGKNATIDMLISFYQGKMDVLREREEHLKSVSKDSRNLLEEKRKKDEEVATVKQQITDCSKELTELTEKLDGLKVKEQELTLIEHQLKEELNRNENEIVNGLYEIILTQQGEYQAGSDEPAPAEAPGVEAAAEMAAAEENTPAGEASSDTRKLTEQDEQMQAGPDTRTITAVFEPPILISDPDREDSEQDDAQQPLDYVLPQKKEPPPFSRSVVKTTRGRIIGEYFYDRKLYKNERAYIMHSAFFSEKLLEYTRQLKLKFDLSVYNEMLQMIHDAHKRVTEQKGLHFEVATNEILNDATIKRLWQDAKLRSIDEVERFGVRLRAKIDALGSNHITMLKEQMQRCTEKS